METERRVAGPVAAGRNGEVGAVQRTPTDEDTDDVRGGRA